MRVRRWRSCKDTRDGQEIVVQRVPPQSIAELANPRAAGRGASGAGWLVAMVLVAGSAITIGPHKEIFHNLPPSPSHRVLAWLKASAARCWSIWARPARGSKNSERIPRFMGRPPQARCTINNAIEYRDRKRKKVYAGQG